ncbi:MAG TPA: 50S ribosomal protein L23 [Negativicutes bacterium]|nr:50S ribosomal protein L23 [Negativicutes bacterium]
MALLDFLKNKKEKDKAKEKKQSKTEPVLPAAQKSAEINTEKHGNKNAGKFSYTIVKEPHISEKGTILAEGNQYVFRVYDRANKPEIKKAVEGIYGVNVLAVNVIQIPKKKRRLGRTQGFKKAYGKAIVTIKEGQKIEIF